jgi:predicted transcriptional regulator
MTRIKAIDSSKQKQLLLGIRSEGELFEEVATAFKLAGQGLPSKPINHLYFESAAHMWKKLTPRRMELLHSLRQHGAVSIRKLAAILDRDYKSVHRDVHILLPIGLVQKTAAELITVPWTSILIDLQAMPKATA